MPLTSRPRRASPPLVGRAADLARVEALVADGISLVTLTGPPGVGKTALARRLVDVLSGGEGERAAADEVTITWCDLAEVATVRGLCRAVAEALGAELHAPAADGGDAGADDAALVRGTGEVLGATPRLVVLDNFDRLADLAAAAVGAWIAASAEVQFLVTSRARLRITDEHAHELAPLAVPEGDDAEALASDAVQLWLARVRAHDPSYAPSAEEIPLVARLARELDGLPLALELAASRSTVLGPGSMLARLDQRFDVLRRSERGSPSRSSAMRAAIEVSWELLDADGREALAQASVFRGGFSLEAAEATIDLGPSGRPVLDVVQDLRERSLLHAAPTSRKLGEARFAMHRSVRAFAEEKLAESGGEAAVLARWQRWLLAFGERAGVGLFGPDPAAAYARVALERENLLGCVRDAIAGTAEDAAAALRLLVALEEALAVDALDDDVFGLVDAALAAAGETDARAVARGLAFRARIHRRAARPEAAERDARAAVALAEREGLLAEAARAAVGVTWSLLMQARVPEAEAAAGSAVAFAKAAGDRLMEGWAELVLAESARNAGREEVFRCDAAVAAFRAAGSKLYEQMALSTRALLQFDAGDVAGARATATRAIGMFPDVETLRTQWVLPRRVLAHVALEEGRIDEARAGFAATVRRARERGRLHEVVAGRLYLGLVLRAAGDLTGARAEIEAVLDDAFRLDRRHGTIFCGGLAAIEADLDHVESAEGLLRRAREHLGADADEAAACAIALSAGHVALAHGRRAAARGDGAAAARLRDEARVALVAAERWDREPNRDEPGATRRIAGLNETRQFARFLARALDAQAPQPEEGPRRLRVHASGVWFDPPGGARVDCARRPVMRRIVAALAREHVAHAGRPLGATDLIAEGWPGERIRPDAARDRLHMMISRVRDLGLREALRASGDGYFFDPALRVEVIDDT